MADNAEGCNNVWGFSVEQMNYYGRLTPVHQAELPTLFYPSPDERVGQIQKDLEKLVSPDDYDFHKEVRPVEQAISMRKFNTQRFQETLSLNMLVSMLFPYPCLESTADATVKLLLSDIENNELICSLYPWQDSYYPEDEKFKINRKLSDGWSYGQVFSDLDYWEKRKAKISIKNFKRLIEASYKPWRIGQACPTRKHLMSTLRIWESYAYADAVAGDFDKKDDIPVFQPEKENSSDIYEMWTQALKDYWTDNPDCKNKYNACEGLVAAWQRGERGVNDWNKGEVPSVRHLFNVVNISASELKKL